MTVTEEGRLHKGINGNNKRHSIEEMVLFSEPQPVKHRELDSEKVAIQDCKTRLLISRAFQVGKKNEFTKCRHWQPRNPTSHGESQSPIGGAQDHLITGNFLSGDLKTASGTSCILFSGAVYTLCLFTKDGIQLGCNGVLILHQQWVHLMSNGNVQYPPPTHTHTSSPSAGDSLRLLLFRAGGGPSGQLYQLPELWRVCPVQGPVLCLDGETVSRHQAGSTREVRSQYSITPLGQLVLL